MEHASSDSEPLDLSLRGWLWSLAVRAARLPTAQPIPGATLRRAALVELESAGLLLGAAAESPADAFAEPRRIGSAQEAACLTCATVLARVAASALPSRRARAQQIAAVLAIASGRHDFAVALASGLAEGEACKVSAKVAPLLGQRWLLATDMSALPVHFGLVALDARMAAHALGLLANGALDKPSLVRLARAGSGYRRALVEGLAGLYQPDARQILMARLRAIAPDLAEFRSLAAAIAKPRSPEGIARALRTPAARRFAVERVVVAAQLSGAWLPAEIAYVERLARACGLSADDLHALESRVAQLYRRAAAHQSALAATPSLPKLGRQLSERAQFAVADNMGRLMREIRQTRELAELLAKAASGTTLTSAEKKLVKTQLLDLAKAIPALAVFAAPGGMILLPVLLKLLPFNLLPSAFIDTPEERK